MTKAATKKAARKRATHGLPKVSLINGHAQTLTFLGSRVHYTRAPADDVRRILRDCVDQATGEPDRIEAGNRIIETWVTGWDDFLDAKGRPTPFDRDLLRPGLPLDLKLALENAICAAYTESELGKVG